MRINNLVFVIALFAWIISALPANAQSVAIPDTNFLKFLKLNYPRTIDASDKLLILEAGKVRGSFLCDNKSVKNVEGLQYFTNISNLNLSNNDLQQLPTFLNLGVLESINISNNKLTALPNLTRNRRLKEIIASNNLIASGINFSGNDSLRKLIINNNLLTSLPNLDNLIELTELDLVSNKITQLPSLNKLVQLRQLLCKNNLLTALPALDSLNNLLALDASYNLLVAMPAFSDKNKIQTLNLNNNKITKVIDKPVFSNLIKLWIYRNELTFKELLKLTSIINYSSLVVAAPQNRVLIGNVQNAIEGDAMKLSSGIDKGITGVEYVWYKNALKLSGMKDTIEFKKIALSDSGYYSCKLMHPSFPGLVLQTDSINLKVSPCLNIKTYAISISDITCSKKGTISVSGPNLNSLNYTLKAQSSGKVFTSTTGNFSSLDETLYHLILITQSGCEKSFDEIKIAKENCRQILITPNGDGEDDSYFFQQTGILKVYNKNGEIVKTLTLPSVWDGSGNDGTATPGYYVGEINGGTEKVRISILH